MTQNAWEEGEKRMEAIGQNGNEGMHYPYCRPLVQPDKDTVREARHLAGWTQTKAAQAVHVSDRAWQRWEQGTRPMGLQPWELFLLKAGLLTL